MNSSRFVLTASLLAGVLALATVHAADYKTPRTGFGHPDLQGVWATPFIVPLEARADAPALTVSAPEAKALALKIANDVDGLAALKLDPETAAVSYDTAEKHGLAIVRGERRTRQIVQPVDGKLPLTKMARQQLDYVNNLLATNPDPPSPADGPEQRPNWERCLNGFGLPPIAIVGDDRRRIVQTQGHVVLYVEYGDDTRIIPFSDKHGPAVVSPMIGDAIARWEGDTLVIETIRLPAKDRIRPFPGAAMIVSEAATVIEKFTRVAKDELLYQYTVVDPKTYTQPWLAEYSLYPTDQRTFEFACHEGNYSMPGILAGARAKERREKAQ